jgi:hypothetical protein
LPNKQTINTAIVDGASDGTTTLPPVDDDDPIRITDPRVQVAKTVTDPADGEVEVNGLVTFTIAITNVGDTRLDIIPVRDLFEPQDLEYVRTSLPTAPQISSGELFWSDVTTDLGDLATGASTSFLITFRFINEEVNSTTNVIRLIDVIDEHGDRPNNPEGQDDTSTVIKSPTGISLLSFTAGVDPNGVEIRWVTGAEIDTFGFHLWRSTDNVRANAVRITDAMIGAQGGSLHGATYQHLDTSAELGRSYHYWLQEIETNGEANEYGPIRYQGDGGGPSTGAIHIFLPSVQK